jgi:hypothetical protein
MSVFIVGGSNSLRKEGWTSYFRHAFPEAINLSVGANSTLVGLFRAMSTPELKAGDTLIWEYALNDVNHLKQGYDPNFLLGFVEHLILHCRTREIKFAPVVLTPLWVERKPDRVPYYEALLHLFDHYGLEPFDMSRAMRGARGVKTLPATVYQDGAHYVESEEVLSFLANGAGLAVHRAKVPAARRTLFTGGRTVMLLDHAPTGAFENSIMRIPSRLPPFRLRMPARGSLAAVAFVTTPAHSAISIRAGSGAKAMRVNLSTTTEPNRRGIDHLLKLASLEVALGKPLFLARDAEIALSVWDRTGALHAETSCEGNIPPTELEPDVHIAGLLFETDPVRARLTRWLLPTDFGPRLRGKLRAVRARLSGALRR